MVKDVGFGVSLFRGEPRLCHLRKTVKLFKPQFPLLQKGAGCNHTNTATNNDKSHGVMNNKGRIRVKSEHHSVHGEAPWYRGGGYRSVLCFPAHPQSSQEQGSVPGGRGGPGSTHKALQSE